MHTVRYHPTPVSPRITDGTAVTGGRIGRRRPFDSEALLGN